MNVKSFGGLTASGVEVNHPTWISEVPELINAEPILASGSGRSYGDLALLTGGRMVSTLGLNKLISFDEESGILECEGGVLLRDIQSIFVRRGWMLAVTPGTSYVTVGGAIAGDVHGKDHHFAGTFGDHVLGLQLIRSSGEILDCSTTQNASLFRATIAGLGLTGFIASARIQLKRVAGPFMDTELITYDSLGEFFALSEETENSKWQASVSWFDCSTSRAGRGSFNRGLPSERGFEEERAGLGLSIPLPMPFSLVNKLSLDLFNSAYFALQKRQAGISVQHYSSFYYPLDGVGNWNRIYGPKGFLQYQSVVPMIDAEAVTSEMLSIIKTSGQGSFLAVLKTFADRKPAGLLSFARHGVTLALDFPNRGPKTADLFAKLDRVVLEAGGTLNPTKDAKMTRDMFTNGYPQLQEFLKHRDPAFVSDFSKRVID
jgi:FAD/FMN-containing dehydrogenase